MSHWYHLLMDNMPFIAATVSPPRLSVTRLVEALIIAAGTAFVTSYVTVARLEERTSLRAEYEEKKFNDQVRRRDAELTQLKAALKEDNTRQQSQYEVLRAELQKITIAVQTRR